MATRKRNQQGFVIITTGLCMVAMIGMLGLAVDLGRLYIVKNEAQTFVDLAGIAGAQELDGTSDGIARARQKVAAAPMKWNFATQNFQEVSVYFSEDNETWTDGSDPRHIKYVLVSTVVSIDYYFIPVVVRPPAGTALLLISYRSSITARAVAGQQLLESFPPGAQGVLPFAPMAHDPGDPTGNFGFQPGDEITLRWPSQSTLNGNPQYCNADDSPQWIEQSAIGGADERGYIQETSSQAIREAIEGDKIFYTVTLGMPVTMSGGVKSTQAASLMDRAAQDLNTTSTKYEHYIQFAHNGRRLGVVPIVNPYDGFKVLGFAKVFLPTHQDQGGNKALCADYVGPYFLMGSDDKGGPGPGNGVFQVRLLP
jgi:Flp pilus assembly protein TadG